MTAQDILDALNDTRGSSPEAKLRLALAPIKEEEPAEEFAAFPREPAEAEAEMGGDEDAPWGRRASGGGMMALSSSGSSSQHSQATAAAIGPLRARRERYAIAGGRPAPLRAVCRVHVARDQFRRLALAGDRVLPGSTQASGEQRRQAENRSQVAHRRCSDGAVANREG